MSEWKNFKAFIETLSEKECRLQLSLAYLHMERCIQVLNGAEIDPVVMKDNGKSSDLELFYACKKARKEIERLRGDSADKEEVEEAV